MLVSLLLSGFIKTAILLLSGKELYVLCPILYICFFVSVFSNLVGINEVLENHREEFSIREGLNVNLLSFMSCDM